MEDNVIKEKNDAMEEFYASKRETWTKCLMPLFKVLKDVPTAVYEMQAEALSYRHGLNEEIAFFLSKLSKEMSSMKKAKRDRFLFYATGYSLKTNTSEKTVLTDGDLSEVDRTIEMLQSHIEFLRDCVKTVDNLQFAVRNRVQLMEYMVK